MRSTLQGHVGDRLEPKRSAGADRQSVTEREGERGHRRHRRDEEPDLDPEEQVVARQPGGEQEGDHAGGPAEGDERVPLERDDRLGEGERHHVAGGAEGEHGERASGQVGVVDDLDHERPDDERADGADDPDGEDEHQQATEPGPELEQFAGGGEPAQAGQQGGLHRLEHEQGDAGEQDAVGELGDLRAVAVAGKQRGGDRTGVEQCGREHRAEQEPAEVGCDLAPCRLRARIGDQRPPGVDEPDPDHRGEGDGEAVGPGRGDPDDSEDHAQDDAHDTVAPHHDGVLAEAPRSRADASSEMGGRVRRERDDQRRQHHPVPVEVVAGDERAEGENRDDDEGDEDRGQPDDLGDDGLAAVAGRPPVGEGASELLLEGEEESGGEGEGGEPQRRDRLELVGAPDRPRADLEEGVRRNARDQQGGRDGNGALRERSAGRRR